MEGEREGEKKGEGEKREKNEREKRDYHFQKLTCHSNLFLAPDSQSKHLSTTGMYTQAFYMCSCLEI